MNVENVQPVNPTPLPGAMTVANPSQRTVDDAEAAAFAQQVGNTPAATVNGGEPDYSNATMADVNEIMFNGIVMQGVNQAAEQRQELKDSMEEQI